MPYFADARCPILPMPDALFGRCPILPMPYALCPMLSDFFLLL